MKRTGYTVLRQILLVLILTVMWIVTVSADEKTLLAGIDEQAGNCKVVSQKIFGYKELEQQEFKSSQLPIEELGKLGFKVMGNLKVPSIVNSPSMTIISIRTLNTPVTNTSKHNALRMSKNQRS